MLIRVTGARAGIADYLRHGLKEDREFSREQMDERVILAGDLDLTDSIIRGMTNTGDKYLHVTLAFREDSISPETLQAVTDEFRAFAFSAYGDDEFNFYAEAQLPRIKSYTDKATGERVVRKPHIHIVIPQKNLLTGTTFNPFKTADFSNEFLKAFQERVNAQYGLASPDDYKRERFNTNSEVVSRYKGDEFAGANTAIKEQIRDAVIARKIESPEAFREYLAEHWAVSQVNSKGRVYFAIKPEGSTKRVRLTDAFFSPENIARPTAEKIAARIEPETAYVAAKTTRQVQEHYREREAYWHAIQAKENKHTNSGRKGEWRAYKALATAADRAAFLAEKEAKFNTTHRQELAHDLTNADRNVIARHIDANVRAAGRHIDAAGRVDRNDERARRKLDDRRVARATRAIVRGRGGDQKQHGERRIERRSDTPAGTHLAKLQDEQQQRSKSRGAMDEIKQRLDGERLLKHLSHTHGVDLTKYQVHRAEQGDRIQCGSRHYNVTDFCTKEMHLSFAEAAPVLRDCYAGQKRERGVEAKQRPREALWQDYKTRWQSEQRPMRAKAVALQKAQQLQEKKAVIDRFRRERASLTATRGMRKPEKDAARSVLRVRQVEAEAALKAKHTAERKELATAHPSRPTFNDYLQDQAQRGKVEALNELRRQAKPTHPEPDPQAVSIEAKRDNEAQAFESLSYRVSHSGEVTYYDSRGDVMRDERNRVQAYRMDTDTLEKALRVAERKFYEPGQKGATTVELAGSDAQIRRAIEVAVEKNINVKFADPKHEAMRRELQAQQKEREELRRKGRDFIAKQGTERDGARKNQAERPTPKPENQRQRPAPEQGTPSKSDKDRGGPGLGG